MLIAPWPIDKIIPYERNARNITPAAVDKVAASIKEFGWRQPIVVDAHGVIIAGHTRLLAARQLNFAEVPVHVADNLSPAQAKAYRLMDNRAHDESSWSLEVLGPELLDLQNLGYGNLE
jgi:ParB-like chromosome segregation protein Spo0J